MLKAKTLQDAILNLDPEPLTDDRFDEFFVDTTQARGGDEAFQTLKRNLEANKLGRLHYLFTGSKGCGKSTELKHLQIALDGNFLVVNFSVRSELDMYKLTHTELLIATMKNLFGEANKANLEIDEAFLEPILSWVDQVYQEVTKTIGYDINAEAGVNAEVGFLRMFKVFAKLTTHAKRDHQFKET